MTLAFFSSQSGFRKWLSKNHLKEKELVVGFYKLSTGKPCMTWSESVDQAICFGWIDGIRKSVDKDSYSIRFTPRKKTSIWSAINIKKVERLLEQNLIQPAGLEIFKHRKEDKSRIYSYENEPVKLSAHFEKKFKANKKAWTFFNKQATGYKKVIIYRIMNAKRVETQLSRLDQIIILCEEQKRLL